MGGKSSKQMREGSRNSSIVNFSNFTKSERLEREELRTNQVVTILNFLKESNPENDDEENKVETLIIELRHICGEMTARLFAKSDLQDTLIQHANNVVEATLSAMNGYPNNSTITTLGLEIILFMQSTRLEGKRDALPEAKLVMRTIDSCLKSNTRLKSNEVELIKLCMEIISGMFENSKEELSQVHCATGLLKVLKVVSSQIRTEFRPFILTLCEKLPNEEEEKSRIVELIVELLNMEKGLTLCEIAENRWEEIDEYISPLLTDLIEKGGANVDQAYPQTGRTALIAACETNQRGLVNFLLQKGANVNLTDKAGRSPLIVAVTSGASADIVQMLLDNGADLSKVVEETQENVFHFVAKGNDAKLPSLLFKHLKEEEKSQVLNARNISGLTPLLANVWSNNADEETSNEILKLFIQAGTDVNVLANNGASALILAVHRRREFETVKLLIESGCDKTVVLQSLTAYDVAKDEGYSEDELNLLEISK